ncbi:hypothetical protein DPMN_061036 [Dreissena polymorpha]|uniref:Uncharacterized protein n=1 Tax=Dreissena polymorpha TaxID=45954 RepID=A0A9D4HIT7_DREPO|nr:hypothetical protein DPMN_061036 [Dreissena polymorpha]
MVTCHNASVPLLQRKNCRKDGDSRKQHEYGSFEDFVGSNKAWCKLGKVGSLRT